MYLNNTYLITILSIFPPIYPQSCSMLGEQRCILSPRTGFQRIASKQNIESTYPFQARRYCRALIFIVYICLKPAPQNAELEMKTFVQVVNWRIAVRWNLYENKGCRIGQVKKVEIHKDVDLVETRWYRVQGALEHEWYHRVVSPWGG